MHTSSLILTTTSTLLLLGCAHAPPGDLVTAREAYRRASTGTTAQIAPADLHVAKTALDRAERSFADREDAYRTRDLAYVADRKILLAEARATTITEQGRHERADADYATAQTRLVADTRQDLGVAQANLATSQRDGAVAREQLTAEQAARKAADARTAAALAALDTLATVKEEPRGTVITLSGSVLFASNKTTLLPAAQSRLNQVAEVLLASEKRPVLVEGYTDSQGSNAHNLDLSQRRADAVRDYLVSRGYRSDRIVAHGLGEERPVAANTDTEGRANNRRVEIVLGKEE